jgi:hypothetical protein
MILLLAFCSTLNLPQLFVNMFTFFINIITYLFILLFDSFHAINEISRLELLALFKGVSGKKSPILFAVY